MLGASSAATLLPTPPKILPNHVWEEIWEDFWEEQEEIWEEVLGGFILFRLRATHFEQSGELHTNLKLMVFYIKNYNISDRIFFFSFQNLFLC